jgi:hypothetical protein
MSDQTAQAQTSLDQIRDIANSSVGTTMQKMRSISMLVALFAYAMIGSACPPLPPYAAMPASASSSGCEVATATEVAPVKREIDTHGQDIASEVAPGIAPVKTEIDAHMQEIGTEVEHGVDAHMQATEVDAHEQANIDTYLQELANEFAPGVAPEAAEEIATATEVEVAPGYVSSTADTSWQQMTDAADGTDTYGQEIATEVDPGSASSATAAEIEREVPAKARPRTIAQVMSKAEQEEEEHNNRKKKRILIALLNDRLESTSNRRPRPPPPPPPPPPPLQVGW